MQTSADSAAGESRGSSAVADPGNPEPPDDRAPPTGPLVSHPLLELEDFRRNFSFGSVEDCRICSRPRRAKRGKVYRREEGKPETGGGRGRGVAVIPGSTFRRSTSAGSRCCSRLSLSGCRSWRTALASGVCTAYLSRRMTRPHYTSVSAAAVGNGSYHPNVVVVG